MSMPKALSNAFGRDGKKAKVITEYGGKSAKGSRGPKNGATNRLKSKGGRKGG